MVKRSGRGRRGGDPVLAWSTGLKVEVGGTGTVAHAGVVLPRLLADRLGLTTGLAEVLARADFTPVRHRGRVLVDTVAALAAGATGLNDVEALTRQEALFGPGGGASDSTVLRVLDELADRLNPVGLPGRRLARATARARAKAWAAIIDRHGQLPAVKVAGADLVRPATSTVEGDAAPARPVVVIRLDATLIEAASPKTGAAGHYRGGFGFHPMTAWCSNIGDGLAVMLRPGNAGSFTADDHIAVLDAAIVQIPAPWRTDLLVTIDGAGASHDVIDHLTALNTAATQGKRGRRVEYSIGWPVDDRVKKALAIVRESDWTDALTAAGTLDTTGAQVMELTGLLRTGVGGDALTGWPPDLRIIARRTPRASGEQATLDQDPHWRYGAFATNTTSGQVQWLDARHRTQAHVEDKVKELKADGADRLPSVDYDRNAAWLQLSALAVSVTAWLRHLGLDGQLATAEPKALRFRVYAVPARLVRHARAVILKLPADWAFATAIADAWNRLHALHPA